MDGSALGPPRGPETSSFLIQRVNSSQILYHQKKKVPKLVGRYIIGDLLGEGSYGKVKEGIHSENLTRVAIKILKKRKLKKIANGEANVKREISLLKTLNHRHLIKLIDVLYNEEKQKLYMVMEYCIGGLQDMVDSAESSRLPEWQAHAYFVQLLSGLEYLHSRGVIHRDIKPGNLLLSREGEIKISDLGVAEILDQFEPTDRCTSSAGSPAFQPPEIANGASEFDGFKVDIWAAGVTLFNLVSGRYPFDGDNIFMLFENISKCQYEMPTDISHDLADLLRGLLQKDVSKRLTLDQIKHHPWVISTHPFDSPAAPLPLTDVYNSTTLIPYLENLYEEYYDEDGTYGRRLDVSTELIMATGGNFHEAENMKDIREYMKVPRSSEFFEQPSFSQLAMQELQDSRSEVGQREDVPDSLPSDSASGTKPSQVSDDEEDEQTFPRPQSARAKLGEEVGIRVTKSRSTLKQNVQRREVKRITHKNTSCKQM